MAEGPRNGFAAYLIARNAAEGSAALPNRKEPTMTRPDLSPLAALIADCLDMDGECVAESVAAKIEARYTFEPRKQPPDKRIGELCRLAGPVLPGSVSIDDTNAGATFVRILADEGFEIRRIEGGQS